MMMRMAGLLILFAGVALFLCSLAAALSSAGGACSPLVLLDYVTMRWWLSLLVDGAVALGIMHFGFRLGFADSAEKGL